MYIPPRFAETDSETLFAFIEEYGFATFVSGDLEVTHLPLLLNAEKTAPQTIAAARTCRSSASGRIKAGTMASYPLTRQSRTFASINARVRFNCSRVKSFR